MCVIKLLEVVKLKEDIAEDNLKKGEYGTVVYIHQDGKAFEVEFLDKQGYTRAVICLERDQITKKY